MRILQPGTEITLSKPISIEERRKVDLESHDVNAMIFTIGEYMPTPTYYVECGPLYGVRAKEGDGSHHTWTVPASWFEKPPCMFGKET